MIRASYLLQRLKELRVTHVVGLPDNTSAALFELLNEDEKVRLITVTREAEAFAIAAGLWMGGKTPAVLIQNTGLLESGDSLRGTIMRMRIPVLCLITYRGYFQQPVSQADVEAFSRPDLDSAAIVTEPTLQAWGLSYYFLDEDSGSLTRAREESERFSRPVALLIREAFI